MFANVPLQFYRVGMTDDASPDLPGFDESQDLLLDAHRLRGLAHPVRLRLRAELVTHGPATATQLASRIGESSGVTSYHLRQLAAYGFVVDEPGRGNGRERYWRAVHRSTWFDAALTDADDPAVGGEYLRAVARMYAERIVRFADSYEAAAEYLGPEWSGVWGMSDWVLDLDVETAEELGRRFHELCLPYRHDPERPRPGTRQVVVQFQLLPTAEHTA